MNRLMASALALTVTGFSMVAAAPASAHPDHWMYTPGGLGKGMYSSENTVYCNNYGRGTYVVVHFKNSANGPVHHTDGLVYGGCYSERHPVVYEFRVCGSGDGCSVWHRAD
jgi:hypothetical protein